MRAVLGLTLFVALLAGCGGDSPQRRFSSPMTETLPTDRSGKFVLYVSNQSSAIDPVDIRITIDGKTAVDREFDAEDKHNWVEFRFALRDGRHTLRAESQAGDAMLVRAFSDARARV